jgi:ribosomal protein S6E (S10)
MKNTQEGLRLRKTVRGNEISADTVQINLSVKKEGSKKFESLLPVKEEKK